VTFGNLGKVEMYAGKTGQAVAGTAAAVFPEQ
jgi:hypothetical protein